MAKGFNLRVSLPSLRFCHSKKTSSMPISPSAANIIFSAINPNTFEIAYPKLPPPTPRSLTNPFSKRNLLSKVLSFGSSGCLSEQSIAYANSLCKMDSTDYKVMKDYDSVQKLCNSPVYSEDLEESLTMWHVDPFNTENYNSKDLPTSFTMSFSSADSNDWFSREDYDQQNEKESESLFSYCSSLDSSYDFGYSNTSISYQKQTYGSKRKKKNAKLRRLKRYGSSDPRDGGDQKRNAFGKLMPCVVEGKVNESYAVMKKSSDPYEDFKKSMIEMILEKEISEPEELEKLLMCFLSLNTKEHHGVIVEAFTEVWEELFCISELELQEVESVQLSKKLTI